MNLSEGKKRKGGQNTKSQNLRPAIKVVGQSKKDIFKVKRFVLLAEL